MKAQGVQQSNGTLDIDCQLVDRLVQSEIPRHSAADPQRMNPDDVRTNMTLDLL